MSDASLIITKYYYVYAVKMNGDWRKWYTCERHHPVMWVMHGEYADATKTSGSERNRNWDLCAKCRTW